MKTPDYFPIRAAFVFLAIGLIAVLLLLSGCDKTSIGTVETNNTKIVVELLFEKDGVKVYRFYDMEAGQYVYYADKGRTSWQTTTSDGENTTTTKHAVETAQ